MRSACALRCATARLHAPRECAAWSDETPATACVCAAHALLRSGDGGGRALSCESAALSVPPSAWLCDALQRALAANFEVASVTMTQCPDLTKELRLAAPGLCGDCALVDVGGVPNLLDPARHGTAFHMADVARAIGMPGCALMGAGATSVKVMGTNAELMASEHLSAGRRCSHCAWVKDDGNYACKPYASPEFGLMVNLLACRGERGPVVHVRAANRSGKLNFVTCMRLGLESALASLPAECRPQGAAPHIGMGGVFQVVEGRIRAHVMPKFKSTVMVEGPEIDAWLRFYEMGPKLTCLTTFVTGDPTGGVLNLRLEHTHFFNEETGQGGHYHYDVTPREVVYEAFLVPCARVFRVENAYKLPVPASSAVDAAAAAAAAAGKHPCAE